MATRRAGEGSVREPAGAGAAADLARVGGDAGPALAGPDAKGARASGDADLARVGVLIGDPTRVRVLMALADGRALPASRLAAEAGVAPSTVSEHLARLLAGGMVAVRTEGRSRFYRLASPAVADVLEAMARIAPTEPIRSLRQHTHAHALRQARTCYRHLAGRLGVGLMRGMLGRGLLAGGDGMHHSERAARDRLSAPGRDLAYRLTGAGARALAGIGLDLDAVLAKGPAVRYCVDWSEERHHLAGPLGTALCERLFELDWVRRTGQRRVVRVTGAGQRGLGEVLGLPAGWDGAGWDGAGWDGAGWDGAGWDGAGWDGAGWDGAGWDGAGSDGAGWDGAGWDGARPDRADRVPLRHGADEG